MGNMTRKKQKTKKRARMKNLLLASHHHHPPSYLWTRSFTRPHHHDQTTDACRHVSPSNRQTHPKCPGKTRLLGPFVPLALNSIAQPSRKVSQPRTPSAYAAHRSCAGASTTPWRSFTNGTWAPLHTPRAAARRNSRCLGPGEMVGGPGRLAAEQRARTVRFRFGFRIRRSHFFWSRRCDQMDQAPGEVSRFVKFLSRLIRTFSMRPHRHYPQSFRTQRSSRNPDFVGCRPTV